ncbi:alpha/beta fold hydrolase [Devosia sp.]|jgi:pimeloyl-ACP methyl ester carboxylesterase|uniref:alpha/beta fold hydrolase n=1 Tax=Devosia sp. TaxID=1871048 RepID=UPI0037BE8182
MQSSFVTSDGLSLAWYELGSGDALPPILLQHGFSASTYSEWVECGIAKSLATLGRRVIGLDARGHGRSEKPHLSRYYGEVLMARDISELVDHLGITQFDLVGYSMGGVIATQVATREPRLRRVVISGVGEAVVLTGGVDRRVLATDELAACLRATDPTSFSPIAQAFRAGAEVRANDLAALAAQCDAVADRVIDFAAITADTLVVAGDTDPLAVHPERLAAAIAGARLVLVPGDHTAARLSAEYTAALLDFLG